MPLTISNTSNSLCVGEHTINDREPPDCTFYLVPRYISIFMQNTSFALELLTILIIAYVGERIITPAKEEPSY